MIQAQYTQITLVSLFFRLKIVCGQFLWIELSHLMTKPAKRLCAQQRLGSDWASAQWVAKDTSFLHADSKDWSDWADAQADIHPVWSESSLGAHAILLVLSRGGSGLKFFLKTVFTVPILNLEWPWKWTKTNYKIHLAVWKKKRLPSWIKLLKILISTITIPAHYFINKSSVPQLNRPR